MSPQPPESTGDAERPASGRPEDGLIRKGLSPLGRVAAAGKGDGRGGLAGRPEGHMGVCETCGNSYDKTFTVSVGGEAHVFDCFECAIYRLAPHCAGCDCLVIGHGVEADGDIYCSAHCASGTGVAELRDRAESPAVSPL